MSRDPNGCPECARSFGPWYRGKCEHGGAILPPSGRFPVLYTVEIKDGAEGGGYSREFSSRRAASSFARRECAARYRERTTATVYADGIAVARWLNVGGKARAV